MSADSGLPVAFRSMEGFGRRLNQVGEVATGVLEQDCGDGPHGLWRMAEDDTKRLETPVLGVDAVRYERSGRNPSISQSSLVRLSRRETHGLQH